MATYVVMTLDLLRPVMADGSMIQLMSLNSSSSSSSVIKHMSDAYVYIE